MYPPQSWQYTCDASAEHIQHGASTEWQHDDVSNPLRNLAHDSAAITSRSSWVLFLLQCTVVDVPCSLCKQLRSMSSKSNSADPPSCPVMILAQSRNRHTRAWLVQDVRGLKLPGLALLSLACASFVILSISWRITVYSYVCICNAVAHLEILFIGYLRYRYHMWHRSR